MKPKVYNVNEPVNFYIPFKKMDEERGIVYGYATTPHLDYDKQKIDMASVAKALPEYLEWGNIREMHERKAVGVVLNEAVEMTDDGLFIGAKIVDKEVQVKIKEGVYKGFSIGLSGCEIRKSDDAPNGILTGDNMAIIEISVVDRPANPKAIVTAYKVHEGKVETTLEKLALSDSEVSPSKPAAASPSGAAPVKFLTFAKAWQAGETMEDLPKMVDTLFSVMGNIIYSPEGTAEDKKAALVASVSEFSDQCASYMTGEKLAETRGKFLLTLAEAAFSRLTAEDAKALSEKDAWKKFFVVTVEPKPEPAEEKKIQDALIEKALKTVEDKLSVKLDEATAQLGALRDENGKLAEANKGLAERLEKVESRAAPPKGKVNTDITESVGQFGDMNLKEIADVLQAMARSTDPRMVKMASEVGTKLFTKAIGGN